MVLLLRAINIMIMRAIGVLMHSQCFALKKKSQVTIVHQRFYISADSAIYNAYKQPVFTHPFEDESKDGRQHVRDDCKIYLFR